MGINPQSFGIQRTAQPSYTSKTQETTPVFSDGFQASEATGVQPNAVPQAAQPSITLKATPSQMATQGFQQTLATLAASGVPVQIVLVAEQTLSPNADLSALKQNDARQDRDISNLGGQVSYLSDRVNNYIKPPAPEPKPPHQTPSYGSD